MGLCDTNDIQIFGNVMKIWMLNFRLITTSAVGIDIVHANLNTMVGHLCLLHVRVAMRGVASE